jgi:DNA-binding PadR family transcriptional regulator
MARVRKLSEQSVAVVLALGKAPTAWRYGYDLCRELDLKAGSMYPILMRLADRGLLETKWDSDALPGRPPRHLYRLTGPGRALATELATLAGTETPAGTRRSGRQPRPSWEGT